MLNFAQHLVTGKVFVNIWSAAYVMFLAAAAGQRACSCSNIPKVRTDNSMSDENTEQNCIQSILHE